MGFLRRDPALLQRRAALVGSAQMAIDGQRVRLPAGGQLDLGGIAKGYIADGVVRLLRAQGVASAVVNLGGNTCVLGRRPDGEPWRIGIQRPQAGSLQYAAKISAQDVSVVTSGIYERGYDRHGRRVHHILNPQSGLPAENDLAAVTVISSRSVEADAYSTAFLCAGSARAREMLAALPQLQVFFQFRDGSSQWAAPPQGGSPAYGI